MSGFHPRYPQTGAGIPTGQGRGRPILGQGVRYPCESQEAYQPYSTPNNIMYAPPVLPEAPANNSYELFSSIVTTSSLSVDAAEFVPRQSVMVDSTAVPNVDPVAETQNAITVLTMSPGDYESILRPLTATLSQAVTNETALNNIVNLIVEKGISEPNFRYTAARMCGYLSSHLPCQFASGNFRQLLLKRCHTEHKQREELMADDNRRHILIGFTLFMGELFLNVSVGSEQQKMKILCTALQELLQTLLSHPTEPSLSCVVQVLKLTGADLEDREKVDSEDKKTPQMDCVLTNIKKNIVESNWRRSLKRQLLSVIELRAGRWGRQCVVSNPPPPPSDAVLAGGVFYGNDGETYTVEDASFAADPATEEAEQAYYEHLQQSGGQGDPAASSYPYWNTHSQNYMTQ